MAYPSLSGSDYFHLLIDRKMKRFGMAGNISRIHFEFDENADLNAIADSIGNNSTFQNVSAVRFRLRWPWLPTWVKTQNKTTNIQIRREVSRAEFETDILNRKVDNGIGLVWVDLCELEDHSKHVVISMHHALFDHQGMMNFIHGLNDDFNGPMFRESEPASVLKMILNAGRMNYELFKRSVWNLGSFFHLKKPQKLTPAFKVIEFTNDETKIISENAWNAGARIGESTFHLSVTAQAVYTVLKKRGLAVPYLWFSIPHNQRKLGTKGHLLSNKLSFLFFKLTETELKSSSDCTKSILEQLKSQIKAKATERYIDLMKMMRFIPMPVYEKMVSVPSGGKLSSFGFSDLGTDQLQMESFCTGKIKNVFRYPPIPTPPGFNVASVRTQNGLRLILAYGMELIEEKEVELLISELRSGLLANSE